MSAYQLGTQLKLTATFKDENGQLVDPTDVTCEVKRLKDGEVDTPAAARQSLGVYRATYLPTTTGQYQYKFTGTGAVIAAGGGRFSVNTSF